MVGCWSAITQFHSTSPFSFWMVVTDSRCQCTEANFFHQQHVAIWQTALAFLLAASERLNGSALHILPGKLIYLGGILINVLPYPYILCNGFLLINLPVNYLLIRFPQRYIFLFVVTVPGLNVLLQFTGSCGHKSRVRGFLHPWVEGQWTPCN